MRLPDLLRTLGRTPGARLVALVPLAVLAATSSATLPALPAAAHVLVVGTDYAFQLPSRIEAGPTTFSFENQGSVRHELAIALLKGTVSPDSAVKGLADGTLVASDVVEGQAALIVARPGQGRESAGAPSAPRLWLDLRRGRAYLVGCTLRDGPQGKPHALLGMVTSFTAR